VRPGEIPVWEPGALVQIRKGVTGAGDIGLVIGPGALSHCLGVLFREGVVDVHPSNLQKPDGRSRRR
jgi:hypothetical protein